MKNIFIKYSFLILVISFVLIFSRGNYYRYSPEFFLLFCSIPSFCRYIYFFMLFREELIRNTHFESEILKGSYPKAGLKLFVKSNIKEIEFLRKKATSGVIVFSASIPIIFILSLLTFHDDIPRFTKDLLSCFKIR